VGLYNLINRFIPTRRSLWNGHQGGAFRARHYKNPFKDPFGPILFAQVGLGDKNNLRKFF